MSLSPLPKYHEAHKSKDKLQLRFQLYKDKL